MNFYMTLSSNVDSLKVFGSTNKISEFKTKLGRNIELDGDWVVGLAGISYTKSWFNVLSPHQISLFDELGKVHSSNLKTNLDKFTISNGYYETPQRLVNEINKVLNTFTTIKPPILQYNEIDNCVTLECGKIDKTIKVFPNLGDEVENILGLRNRNLNNLLYSHDKHVSGLAEYIFRGGDIFREDKIKAFHPVEISGGYHALYLYSDVVYPSLVGDSFSQLLRVVEVPRRYKFGDTVHLNYDRPHYIPVMLNNFETIEMCIKDDTDNLVPFMFGRCTCVLHFKKV